MARCKLHIKDDLALEAIGRRGEVLGEARQVLATAQLCVETVLAEHGDDGTLHQVSQTLDLWKQATDSVRHE